MTCACFSLHRDKEMHFKGIQKQNILQSLCDGRSLHSLLASKQVRIEYIGSVLLFFSTFTRFCKIRNTKYMTFYVYNTNVREILPIIFYFT